MSNAKKFILFAVLNLLFLIHHPSSVLAATPDELKKAIDEKTQQLLEVNQQITQAQKDLDTTQTKSSSLQKELKTFDYNINQLNLSIKSSELNIQKLNLEIEGLKYDITDTESQIDVKKLAIADLLRELQQKDADTTLAIFLKNKSLAGSLDEIQNIIDFNSGLSVDVGILQTLNDQLSTKLTDRSTKKAKVELENKNLKNRKIILQNQKTDRQSLLTQTKNQEKNYQQLVTQLEKEQESLSNEINDTEAKLRASFNPNLLPSKRPGVLSWPVKLKIDGGTAGVISQIYGALSRLYKAGWHNGLDIGSLPVGSPIFAADDGKVSAVDNNDRSYWQKYQYGQYILIQHLNNLTTLYAHLSVTVVKNGDNIHRGDLIGYSGNTGFSTGPHLHFGVYWTPSILLKNLPPARGLVPIGVTIDPKDYL
jgi:murein DD-endopeptidase MepM/ murein hydrolase activator NlpD